MTFDIRGTKTESDNSIFNNFVDFIKEQDFDGWEYLGMSVELDPTVCYSDESILIRWQDLDEGFNDRIVFNTIEEFKKNFKRVVA
ncbi:MAG: hypothetical protein UHW86_06175 [Spirochaetota bacterium]|jgi:hypothetical protein|nr:hypothetical protein [Spirochaetota bacterium]